MIHAIALLAMAIIAVFSVFYFFRDEDTKHAHK